MYTMQSSLMFEVLLYLNSFYFGMLALCELGLVAFKVANLPYPESALATDMTVLLLLFLVEALRITLGRNGNLTERNGPLLASLGLLIPSLLGVLHILLWQTYVLRLEVVLASLQLAIMACEVTAAFLCVMSFSRSHRSL
ncbi:transmembrane protein 216-like isoform X1 [Ischnura elegans]|uniref:transmembrane protein 216-like isoform X1 n=1 Tax=Ischnura elegans TaxID=197161 RepID=UPI001ED8887A|nr:transmembrane protein 216-like isoform X1 [Ischnura elegans]XP_046385392.1 transmembrane protein 216-like isoform X1 [Ischnura elegans]XP_046385393.1 transmembrane protein 216-like isoform X1 [Ischnura elegans]